jgi:predicted nucleic acid-binding protein
VKVVADTGPLVAAANRRDRAHGLAAALVTEIGRDLIVPLPVVVEVDQLVRARISPRAARSFLAAMVAGEHTVAFPTAGVLRSAATLDARYADLDLGITDATVMTLAERDDLPILTFDFEDFRAAPPARGYWRLVVDEVRYAKAIAPSR